MRGVLRAARGSRGPDQLRAHADTLLAELPKVGDRQLLTRFYLQDHDRDDVCRALAIDVSHFHGVVFRARERPRTLSPAARMRLPR